MGESFKITFTEPLTEEQYNLITDAEFENTDRIAYRTPKGKVAEFFKATPCTNCIEWHPREATSYGFCVRWGQYTKESDYCSYGK